ncbi:AAA family ATPase [Duganella sp. FT80W]|uniref:AAA family ATPase n=1 Tax=Duganella guangzhouensis TaxID=2666084 RepID=A0A6I2KRW4_9BURK|nr:ATP-dependent RecD-like DNA helicase [Duganella guangzhouensis]MRW88395.1 AAA family ATPase [Duganella guangzhouensis]
MQMECVVSVSELIHVLPDGASIFVGVTEDGTEVRTVASGRVMKSPAILGYTYRLVGIFKSHAEHGRQFHVIECRLEPPGGRLMVNLLARNAAFKGLGKIKAKRLWDVYGDALPQILSAGSISRLSLVLSPMLAEQLVESWAKFKAHSDLLRFLDENGFELCLTEKITTMWGNSALEILRVDPYRMLAFSNWIAVDRAALGMNIGNRDERRLIASVESVLYDQLESGHTLTPTALLCDLVDRRLKFKVADRAIHLAEKSGAIFGESSWGYQTVTIRSMETAIQQRVRALTACRPEATVWIAPPTFAERQQVAELQDGVTLSSEQIDGVLMPFQKAFSVLSVAVGTGETVVLRRVVEHAAKKSIPVLQLAVPQRAAQRLSAATSHPAMTCAKLLSQVNNGFAVPDGAIVIIAEASTLDVATFFKLLRVLPDTVNILLVGDESKLPPTNFGLVLHRLVDVAGIPTITLGQLEGQVDRFSMQVAAQAVLARQFPKFVPFTGRHAGVSFVNCTSDQVFSELRNIANEWDGDDFQFLSNVKVGRDSVNSINKAFHAEQCEEIYGYPYLITSEPVIFQINDYERGLVKGSLGRVIRQIDGSGVEVDFDGEKHVISNFELTQKIDLAYAITVQEAHGSNFSRVAVVLGSSTVPDQTLIYTALACGIEQVVFVGDSKVFELAVMGGHSAHTRMVGINFSMVEAS